MSASASRPINGCCRIISILPTWALRASILTGTPLSKRESRSQSRYATAPSPGNPNVAHMLPSLFDISYRARPAVSRDEIYSSDAFCNRISMLSISATPASLIECKFSSARATASCRDIPFRPARHDNGFFDLCIAISIRLRPSWARKSHQPRLDSDWPRRLRPRLRKGRPYGGLSFPKGDRTL